MYKDLRTESNQLGYTRSEAAASRSKLRLRYNPYSRTHQVYSSIAGNGAIGAIWRWIHISQSTYEEYQTRFPGIKIVEYSEQEL